MYELLQVNIAIAIKIKDREESLSNNTRELRVLCQYYLKWENGMFIDPRNI